ncbi:MAG TPA: glycosyltransferase family 4 protein [Microthrixaceae bacterium]|nr:glycosyltransferase family 4 protein [Microthrixaceae bacterium]
MSQRVGFLSFRFGTTDGVSAVTRTWMEAFRSFGFDVVTISGEAGSDVVVDGIGLTPPAAYGPREEEIRRDVIDATADLDLVVVENLLTIPLNLVASRAVASALEGRPAVIHHHDPPWHRQRFAHITELPATDPAWQHVSINGLLQSELAARGIASTLIYNGFVAPDLTDLAVRAHLRKQTRASLGVADDETLLAHPVRAIERKNVPAAIRTAEELNATYWLLGPAEEGYGLELAQLLAAAKCRIVHQPWSDTDGIYAAADHVLFPSTWEGFGNPPVEAAFQRRTVSVGAYPVGAELRQLGFDWLDSNDISGIAAAVRDPHSERVRAMLDANEQVAHAHFSIPRMRDSLRRLLDDAGFLP